MITFPYGRAAFALLLLGVFAGLYLIFTPPEKKNSTLVMWTFARPHYEAYLKTIPDFEKAHPGVKVDLELVNGQAVGNRLQASFWANLPVPDMVETEISTAGSFFRGPVKDIGFVDLTDRLKRSGLYDRMVQARFAPYTSRGRIFGLPHDVHPVQLAYNREIFKQAGINPDDLKTWDEFIAAGHKITIPGKRYMIELGDSNADNMEAMLFQRGGGYFDPQGRCILDNEAAVQTMLFYVPLVAGPHKIANTLGGNQILTQAVEDGYLVTLLCPDWRSKSIEQDIPSMSGKMGLMPLPAVAPGLPQTSTWGGTMLGITKASKNQDLAWQFAMNLYTDKSQLEQRFLDTNILPAFKDAWNQPGFAKPRAYWGGQPLGLTYAKLAPQVPFQYTSPLIGTAKTKMGEAVVSCVQYYNQNGDKDFAPFVRARLKQSAEEVRQLAARNPY